MPSRCNTLDTKVTDAAERLKMFGETPAQLAARNGAMLNLALALEPEHRVRKSTVDARDGAIERLRHFAVTARLADGLETPPTVTTTGCDPTLSDAGTT